MKQVVGIIMASASEWDTMGHAAEALESLAIPYEVEVVSAHCTCNKLSQYADQPPARGLEVIIAGAGCAAHVSTMIAAKTHLPVLGVPIESKAFQGVGSLPLGEALRRRFDDFSLLHWLTSSHWRRRSMWSGC